MTTEASPTPRAEPAEYTYIWEYLVLPDRVDDFAALYGPRGEWCELFRKSPRYIKTELFRDRDRPNRFVTVDYWTSYDAWLEWRAQFATEFEELDRLGEQLTAHESRIGEFDSRPHG